MQKNIDHVVEVLKNDHHAENIFTSNEPYFRKLEGLPEEDEILAGIRAPEMISDGSISYKIDFDQSQKTGFYFDQCDNREFIHRFVKGKKVLDAFCNSGGFGMHAALAGAESVTFVDSSSSAIKNAKENYSLNELSATADFAESDVFDFLEKCIKDETKFDVVMLDPPAFAKSRKSIPTALKGYTKLNTLALACIESGGYLVSSSCSYHVKEEDFLSSVNKASVKSKKPLKLIHKAGASLDHPMLPAMEETSYLKFMAFKVGE
jgi:23S rRNA (cytosine1962-C5)-methyltransferase